ncbi:MAG: glycosyl transferase [Alphaproteobacteria bacterium]|jgi:hypothetical protein|nr:glycosyl transferase [Alphaproteobacteria bacterium]
MKDKLLELASYLILSKRKRSSFRAKHKILPVKELKKLFLKRKGYKLDLKNPKTFSEKVQWLKYYTKNNSTMRLCADKHLVRDYIASKGFEDILVKSYGVWDKLEDIEWNKLPKRFVIKLTHDSGGVWIVKDKNKFDKEAFFVEAEKKLKKKYGAQKAEFNYVGIKPRIIAEEFLEEDDGSELKDYKFFCFNGDPKYIQVDFDRNSNHTRTFFDAKWKDMRFTSAGYPLTNEKLKKPAEFDRMLDIARELSKEFYFARIDFYFTNGKIYFGEVTFWNGSGMVDFNPLDWDQKFGDLLILPINE